MVDCDSAVGKLSRPIGKEAWRSARRHPCVAPSCAYGLGIDIKTAHLSGQQQPLQQSRWPLFAPVTVARVRRIALLRWMRQAASRASTLDAEDQLPARPMAATAAQRHSTGGAAAAASSES